MNLTSLVYHGWRVTFLRDNIRDKDVYIAKKYGVEMNSSTFEGIKQMIRDKEYEKTQAK